jgi:DNA replication protein DnaC
MVRTSGAFVAGYELRGVLAYFATDGDRNQTKAMLEALFRSVPDVSMRIQFRYEISEHLGDLLDSYIHEQRTEQSEVMALDTHRLRMWRQKENSGAFFENRLHVYFNWDPRVHAKLYHSAQQNRSIGGFTLSQKKAIQRTRKEHETYLAEFESILRGIEGSMEAAKSHIAQAVGHAVIQQGYRVLYREAHALLEELADATLDGKRKQHMELLTTVPLLIIDDLGMRKLPLTAAEELLEIIMRRYERASTLLTSNRPVEDWGKLLGDSAAVSAMLDRLLHHGHVLKCGPRSWRTKTSGEGKSQ